jgi:hypothetical protein
MLAVSFSFFTSLANAAQTATQKRYQEVYESIKKVDECRARASISPLTFGEKENEISILTFANLGSIMIGNDSKSYKLALNTGTIQSYNNGKWETFTYVIDSKTFLEQLKNMHSFVNQALGLAQQVGKSKYIDQVTCASKMIEIAEAKHQPAKNLVQK